MALETIFDNASSVMTVISFITFVGILWWTYSGHRASAYATAAQLPFADDEEHTHV
ncbi:CcoQ/FixQ family Cbb3-type cytochrome c oxidase assembly chaperone [Duganella sp. LX20W]|uniref:CcoQ/FixQ family Cbb3-type cytochrome c oxidase assembly chaperone n=2 Tax=Rugamonas TaxID=212744 RepID=A0A7W2EQH6_9BURK|nr:MULTISPECIES: CcoQ/FixQ family Cbb3-type cytochrome c oxidase assembly chaperone [Rugamonas]MBA5604801.1 CcoQ/FixQ family Cbb3-type cytochrome c oxidase assembly chaperone [Rugamonas fusca]MBA5636756.1 CcoQ/FixQ family Cbb3-type cytochrome c oxidase assembly chaperone [Rugamonas brunnea]